jgi:hypothetical protein
MEAFVTARAATARLPRLIPPPVRRDESPFARMTVSMEFTRRPTYAVVQQNGPAASGDRVIHWVDLHAVFPDGPVRPIRQDRVLNRVETRFYISVQAPSDNPWCRSVQSPRPRRCARRIGRT